MRFFGLFIEKLLLVDIYGLNGHQTTTLLKLRITKGLAFVVYLHYRCTALLLSAYNVAVC